MPDLFTNTAPQEEKIISATKHRPHMFSSYCENPDRVTFVEAEPDEKILLFLRRHFITNVPWIFFSMILLFAPIPFHLVVNFFSIDLSFMPANSLLLLLSFYYLIIFAYAVVSYFTWFFNISLITQKRVVDIDFADLVYKNVAATKIDLVEDVSYSQVGVIRSLLDYGDVLIQTAATLDNFDLHAVPKPERVIQIVESLIGNKKGN